MKRKKINESFEYCRSEKNIYFCDESRRSFKLVVFVSFNHSFSLYDNKIRGFPHHYETASYL